MNHRLTAASVQIEVEVMQAGITKVAAGFQRSGRKKAAGNTSSQMAWLLAFAAGPAIIPLSQSIMGGMANTCIVLRYFNAGVT